jgi:deazaflavin-dependent oxidoreductase (nitroreductase family)
MNDLGDSQIKRRERDSETISLFPPLPQSQTVRQILTYRVQIEVNMAKRRYSLFQSFAQKIASSRPGAWFLSRSLHQLDGIFLKLSHQRMTLTSILTGIPVVVLTTIGAKSRLPRTLPLLCIRDTDDPNVLAIIASNWGQHHHPAWYFNLKANPRATCSISGHLGMYIAHEAYGEEYERFWRCASETYIGFPLYKQRAGERSIPIMILTPE